VRSDACWVAGSLALVVVAQPVADVVVRACDSGLKLRVDVGRRGRIGSLQFGSGGRRLLSFRGDCI
jgi:hypothetical protein